MSVISLIDFSVEINKKYSESSSIRYVSQILRNLKYENKSSFGIIFKYISNICEAYPYFIDVLFIIIDNNSDLVDSNDASATISDIINRHLPHKRSDAIVYSIAIALKYNLTIDPDALCKVIDCNDPLPCLFSFLYHHKNNMNIDPFLDKITEIRGGQIDSEWWLYVYEVFRIYKNKRPDVFKKMPFKGYYDWLSKNDISFVVNLKEAKVAPPISSGY